MTSCACVDANKKWSFHEPAARSPNTQAVDTTFTPGSCVCVPVCASVSMCACVLILSSYSASARAPCFRAIHLSASFSIW